MNEWFVDVQSMIPTGQLGDRMMVAKVDNMSNTITIMGPPTLTTYPMYESVPADKVFMTGHSYGDFHKGEIDQFLQAMMDCGWRRGLRPKNFDPSAGELAAVNRHLEDMRKMVTRFGESVQDVKTAIAETENTDVGVDKDKRW